MAESCCKLEEPQNENGFPCFVQLVKDGKSISRIQCSKPPIDLPSIWNITNFIKTDDLPSGLPRTHICPAHEDKHQKTEWPQFLSFLKKYKKVAIAVTDKYQLYILPRCDDQEFGQAVVMYLASDGHSRPKSQSHVKLESKSRKDRHHSEHSKVSLNTCMQDRLMGHTSANYINKDHDSPDCKSRIETCSKSGDSAVVRTFPGKNYVCAHPSYLRTLGQSHSGWIFGAVAELVDNSRDAKATMLDISIDTIYSNIAGKEIPMLAVIDDGQGMSYEEILKMVSFGRMKPDKHDPDYIGRYGVGFKTGAMRLGKDALVLTQTTNSRSVAFLSQSLNEGKDNIEIPIVTYCRRGQFMELDRSIQTEALSKTNLKSITEFSPFNKYLIGEKAGLFHRKGTGTQIYIWNLDVWGSKHCLEWVNGMSGGSSFHQGDILICSRRVRSRPGQMTREVPLDYSLRSYLEVIFLDPRMKISVQGSQVKGRPLAKFLHKTVIEKGIILKKPVQLILGFSQLELEQGNCGIFLYWHGRLIEAYKRVGSMLYNGEKSHGIIGVIDVTDLMNDDSGHVWVHNNKQGFEDCEPYAQLEEWLSKKADEYMDKNIDNVHVEKGGSQYKPDNEWVQCNKCRKWRMLSSDFDSKTLPQEWFCYMKPFLGKCEMPEQEVAHGVITISSKRSGYSLLENSVEHKEELLEKAHPHPRVIDSSTGNRDSFNQTLKEVANARCLKRHRTWRPRGCKNA